MYLFKIYYFDIFSRKQMSAEVYADTKTEAKSKACLSYKLAMCDILGAICKS